jgi:hypothetical protein
MRLTRFLNEEDAIKKGLEVPEPEVGEKYSKEEVKKYISLIKNAISAQKEDGDEAILKDLEDKLDKWQNVETEVKPAGPVVPAIDIMAAQPPEEGGVPPEEGVPPKKKKPEEDDPKGQKDAEDKAKKAKKK